MTQLKLIKYYNCTDLKCPGHYAEIKYNHSINMYEFNDGKGNIKNFETQSLNKYIEGLRNL